MTPSEAFAEWERLKVVANEAFVALNRPGKRLARSEKERRFEVWCEVSEAVDQFESDLRAGRFD